MTIEQIRALLAVAQSGSFRKAAQQLHRTQSAVSKSIKTLENELEFALFSRQTYRPTLTAQGAAFCKKASETLANVEDLARYARHLSQGAEPVVSLAINHICPMPPVLALLKKLSDDHATTQLDLCTESMHGARDKLLENEVDMAITFLDQDNPLLESVSLTTVNLLNVATPGLFGKRRQKNLPQTQLARHAQIIVRDSSKRTPNYLNIILPGGRHWPVNDFFTKKQIILSGLGWGRLPEHLIQRELQQKILIPLNCANVATSTKVSLKALRRGDRAAGPVAGELWTKLKRLDFNSEKAPLDKKLSGRGTKRTS